MNEAVDIDDVVRYPLRPPDDPAAHPADLERLDRFSAVPGAASFGGLDTDARAAARIAAQSASSITIDAPALSSTASTRVASIRRRTSRARARRRMSRRNSLAVP